MIRLALAALLLSAFAAPADAQRVPCQDGLAGAFPCQGVDLLGHLSIAQMGGGAETEGNDVWGWTDPETGKEYAIMGLTDGTAFIDASDPERPLYLGTLPTHTGSSPWRDVKVYADHAFIVSDRNGDHGMQVFDLTRLRGVTSPQTFSADARYDRIGSAHNVAINEETGFAYVVGVPSQTSNPNVERCGGGLHMVDVRNPLDPIFAGCFAEDGYTHDVQCVLYDGPDAEHAGKEICFTAQGTQFNVSANHYGIVDVTDKAAPVLIAEAIYPNPGYAHQGWLTDDHRFFIANDELDEANGFTSTTRTLVFDVSDLDKPEFHGEFLHATPSIDHNLYVRGRYVFEANYTSGFRLLDAERLLSGAAGDAGLDAIAFFDTYPAGDGPVFQGAWSTYPYFASGTVLISDIDSGLFLLDPQVDLSVSAAPDVAAGTFALSEPYPNPTAGLARLTLTVADAQRVEAAAYDVLGRRVAVLFDGPLAAGESISLNFDGRALPPGTYLVRVAGESFAEVRRVTLTR